ncbi:MAG: M13 family metallopeptidase [Lachnospiraceae bacterium]|nr:M13 family metallopeptidase [Lachnospiraceae bacterium]
MRRKFQKRTVTLIAAVTAAALALTGCDAVSESFSGEALDFLGDEDGWIDSDLIGSMDSVTDVRLQDDFAAAVNAEWKHSVGSAFSDTFQELSDRIYENKKTIVTDESAAGPEADNLRTYYALASDWDGRDKDGTEPLAPYISDIASIDSTEALYDFLADLDRNPMMYGPVFIDQDSLIQSDIHPENYCLAIGAPDMTLTSSMGTNELYFSLDSAQAVEMYESARNRVIYTLGRLGYSEDDAAKIFEGRA